MSKISEESKLYFPLGLKICVELVSIGLCCYILSKGLPYLLDKKTIFIRFSIIFLLLVGFFTYFIYFHKWKTTGYSGFQMAVSKKERANFFSKVKNTLTSFLLILFFSGAMAWAAWGVFACAAYLFSREPIKKELIISDRSKNGRFGLDITLINKQDSNEYVMPISVNDFYNNRDYYQIGNTVCLKGRTSFLGTIVEDFKVGAC